MKIYSEWLDEFRAKIEEGYESHRMDRCLAGFVSEVERPARRLIKMSGPIVAFFGIPEGGELPPPVKVTMSEVTPINVGFPVNLKDWADDPERTYMDMFMMQIGERIAENEVWAIVKGMVDNAGHTLEAEKKGELTKNDVEKAKDWVGNQGTYADTLIVYLEQKTEFLKRGELVEATPNVLGWIPEERRGRHFSGLVNGLFAYWTRFTKGLAIVYERNAIMVRKTPFKIDFDNSTHPSALNIEKWCSSAPTIEQGVVKITL